MSDFFKALTGDVTIHHVSEIYKIVEPGLTEGKDILIDIAAMTDMDISGIQLLLSVKKTSEKSGKQFKLVNIPTHFRDTLKQNGLDPDILS